MANYQSKFSVITLVIPVIGGALHRVNGTQNSMAPTPGDETILRIFGKQRRRRLSIDLPVPDIAVTIEDGEDADRVLEIGDDLVKLSEIEQYYLDHLKMYGGTKEIIKALEEGEHRELLDEIIQRRADKIGGEDDLLLKDMIQRLAAEIDSIQDRQDRPNQAVRANQDGIATNEENITANQEEISANGGKISENEGKIHENEGDIASNKDMINAHDENIATNKDKIDANFDIIVANQDTIDAQHGYIAENKYQINEQKEHIASNKDDINANEGHIITNKGKIQANEGYIATNTNKINTNEYHITANTGNVATNEADIAANETSIIANEGNIAANANDIKHIKWKMDNLNSNDSLESDIKDLESELESLEDLSGEIDDLADHNKKLENELFEIKAQMQKDKLEMYNQMRQEDAKLSDKFEGDLQHDKELFRAELEHDRLVDELTARDLKSQLSGHDEIQQHVNIDLDLHTDIEHAFGEKDRLFIEDLLNLEWWHYLLIGAGMLVVLAAKCLLKSREQSPQDGLPQLF